MFRNFLKTSFRNLWKNKGYSFLNTFGLGIGIACASLIFLWVEDELNFDQFNAKKNLLYFVKETQKYDTYTATFSSTPGVLGPAMLTEIPGIANTCRLTEGGDTRLITIGDKSMYSTGNYTEVSLFSMFTFPFAEGDAKSAFTQLNSMVVTQKTAKKFFGTDKNVVGKQVRVDNKQDYVISGVLKDFPENSSLRFEWLAPFQVWYNVSDWAHKWGNNCLSTYVELKPGAQPASVNKLLYDFIQKREPSSIARPFLFSMNDWHLRNHFDNGVQTGGAIQYVRLFMLIAWIILLIACINFMNLATARSANRAREVGVRKVLGAAKQNLIFQFIGEAVFMALVAAFAGLLLMTLALPAFNTMVEKTLLLNISNPFHIGLFLGITLVCGIVAGSYPSLYLSSFNPASVLKGLKLKTGGAAFIRKGLVILQFSVSIILIISTVIIYQQIQHVKDRNLGFNKNNLLQIDMSGDMAKKYSVIQHDLMNTGLIESIALSDHITLYSGNNTGGLTWEGKTSAAQILISQRYISPGFFKNAGMRMLAGRDLAPTDSTFVKKTIYIVITETLEKLMGKASAIGKTLHFEGDTSGMKAEVVGVVNDYVYGDIYGSPDPVMFFYAKPENTTEMYVRLKQESNIKASLSTIQNVLKKENPAYPFTYQFVNNQFDQMFSNEMLISKLSRIFAGLAIVISCLGLFGLSAYTAEMRIKEIGVRKVLGASVSGITALLSTDFLKLVIVSCLVAIPVSWWMMHNWLQGYQYRIEISWWIFLLATIVAIGIAMITVSFQSIKAAIANPIKSLRTE